MLVVDILRHDDISFDSDVCERRSRIWMLKRIRCHGPSLPKISNSTQCVRYDRLQCSGVFNTMAGGWSSLGLLPELVQACEEDFDWILPSAIQDEAIPLLLGGGDVMVGCRIV